MGVKVVSGDISVNCFSRWTYEANDEDRDNQGGAII